MNPDALRIGAVVVAVIALILLVTRFRLHPFVTLIVVSIFLGLACGLPPVEVIKHFEKGFGDVLSVVGIVIGLGTMLGGVLVFSGGAERLATGLVSLGGKKFVPWTIFFAALLIGLPLFFEVGFVLLVPLAFAISKKMQTSGMMLCANFVRRYVCDSSAASTAPCFGPVVIQRETSKANTGPASRPVGRPTIIA
jgi:gluconate:H+ symporter, GntP family